jgi:hypothetical protein
MTELRFYLDENVNPTVADQLGLHGIDAVTVRDLDMLGDVDTHHLYRAAELGRVLCTHDQDFLMLAASGFEHAGIAFAEHYGATIGGWVKALRSLHDEVTMEEIKGTVRFLRLR